MGLSIVDFLIGTRISSENPLLLANPYSMPDLPKLKVQGRVPFKLIESDRSDCGLCYANINQL